MTSVYRSPVDWVVLAVTVPVTALLLIIAAVCFARLAWAFTWIIVALNFFMMLR